MKQLVYCFLIFLAAAACSDSKKPEDESTDPSKTEKTADKPAEKTSDSISKRNPVVYALTPAQIKQLKKLLPEKTFLAITGYYNDLAMVQTDVDFARVYHNGKKLFAEVEEAVVKKIRDDYKAMEVMSFIDKTFALRSSCEAECTVFTMTYNFKDLQKLALYTKGKADDDFVKLKLMAEGEEARHQPGWLSFFERTWDYGGGSLLGDSNNYTFLETSFQVIQKSDLFKKDLLELRERVLENMEHRIYMYPKAAVMAELTRILKTKILAYDEAHRVLLLRQRIERDKEDPPLQFDCADPEKNCDWGG